MIRILLQIHLGLLWLTTRQGTDLYPEGRPLILSFLYVSVHLTWISIWLNFAFMVLVFVLEFNTLELPWRLFFIAVACAYAIGIIWLARWRRILPRGRRIGRLLRRLQRAIGKHPDGQALLVDEKLLIVERRKHVRGLLRVDILHPEPQPAGREGIYTTVESFCFSPLPKTMYREVISGRIKALGHGLYRFKSTEPAPDLNAFSIFLEQLRNGSIVASEDELRVLADQLSVAIPYNPAISK